MSIINQLKASLHPCLLARIHHAYPARSPASDLPPSDGFVLYLPTVCLRMEQNPAFTLACHAANVRKVPLIVLAVILDDSHHNTTQANATVMTSRRLAFALQALSHSCAQWSSHGAAVGIRIHAPPSNGQIKGRLIKGARIPDHLTMATRASFVVTDEPFVFPYLKMVQKVEEACRKSAVECVRVDGSCTVPPLQVLKRTRNNTGVLFENVPEKAYLWQKKTEGLRAQQLKAAVDGEFDAPKLEVRMEDDELFLSSPNTSNQKAGDVVAKNMLWGQRLAHLFPSRWKPDKDDHGNLIFPNAPDMRPFTSQELLHLFEFDDYFGSETENNNNLSQERKVTSTPFHNFALNWPGADPAVSPVSHTIGTARHGMSRWNNFVQNGGLSRYAKERNDARNNLCGVSRMSAYLNLGVVPIFRLAWDMKQHSTYGGSFQSKWKTGADKFEEELIKFREHSYAHCFSRTDYDDVTSLPRWSVQYLDGQDGQYTIFNLANGTTQCQQWNAMQNYLVRCGELHNNVRMTWGKTVVEWGIDNDTAHLTASQILLKTLCYLNDRYALDGLSPPSYGGLLWCMGWTDKPNNGGVSSKPAYRYRMTVEDFEEAARKLLASSPNNDQTDFGKKSIGKMKGQPSLKGLLVKKSTASCSSKNISAQDEDTRVSVGEKRKATIDSFFQRKSAKSKSS